MTNSDQDIMDKFHKIVDGIKVVEDTSPLRPPDQEYMKLLTFVREYGEDHRDLFVDLIWSDNSDKITVTVH